ncbi:MAG: hypothetical protein JWM64_2448, partial [Frankiales bacterium]|nr:hypothetical protein [Frankiales bacterium]
MRTARPSRALLGLLTAVAVVVGVLPAAAIAAPVAPVAAQATPTATPARLLAGARAPLRAGGVGVAAVGLLAPSDHALTGPLALAVSGLAPGTTLAGALSQPSSDGLDRTWRCAPVTGGGTCTLPPATSLPRGTSTALQLLVRATGTGAVLPARLALRATSAGAEVATTTATLDSAAATTDLLLDVTPPPALQPGARGRVALLVTSLGVGALGPVVVTDVLPAGLQLLAARGSGWGCA